MGQEFLLSSSLFCLIVNLIFLAQEAYQVDIHKPDAHVNPTFVTSTTLDQCALRPDGSLKDASEIHWVNDPDDKIPVASGSGEGTKFSCFYSKLIDGIQQVEVGDPQIQLEWLKFLMQTKPVTTKIPNHHAT
jgi:hypothetical protein